MQAKKKKGQAAYIIPAGNDDSTHRVKATPARPPCHLGVFPTQQIPAKQQNNFLCNAGYGWEAGSYGILQLAKSRRADVQRALQQLDDTLTLLAGWAASCAGTSLCLYT